MFTIIILEDDFRQKDILEEKVKKLNFNFQYNLVSFTKTNEMLEYCENKLDHFIFLLDIVLEKNNTGIDVAKYINLHYSKSYIIYITAYLEKACDVYDTDHCYFIFKPQMDKYLEKAINKAIQTYKKINQEISLKIKEGRINLYVDQIMYIERIKRYSLVRYNNQIIKTTLPLNEYQKILPSTFKYCHSCYLVNFNQVKIKSQNEFVMKDKSIIPIARGYRKTIDESFHQYLLNEMSGEVL